MGTYLEKKFKIYVGRNPQNPQNEFFQKRFGNF